MFCFFAVTGSEYERLVEEICLMGFDRDQVTHVVLLTSTDHFVYVLKWLTVDTKYANVILVALN